MNEKNTNTYQKIIIFSFDEDSNGNADRNNINIHFREMRFNNWEDHENIKRITKLVNDSPRYEDANCYLLNEENEVDIVSEVIEPKEDNNNWVQIGEKSGKIIKDYAKNFLLEGQNKVFDLSRKKNGLFSLENVVEEEEEEEEEIEVGNDKNYRLTSRKNNKLNEFKVTKIPTKTKKKKKSKGFFSFGF